ncbi:hypothetical protein ACTA71_010436, partial [Dictyostelium dimigraforme]
NHLSK